MSLQAILPRDHRPLADKTGIGRSLDINTWRDGIVFGYNAAWCRDKFVGAAPIGLEIDGSAAGTFDLPLSIPVIVDNQGNRITGFDTTNGGTLVLRFKWRIRVNNAAITVTPKIYDLTAGADLTTSGAAACSATATDYSGSNQQQTLTPTFGNNAHEYVGRITIAGTPAAGYTVRCDCRLDVYVDF